MSKATTGLPEDSLASAATADGGWRISAVTLTHAVEKARQAHETLAVVTAALGRAMAGALLLAQGLKEPERLTLRVLGDGPIGGLVVDASPGGEVRGYVKQPRVMLEPNALGKLDVGRAVGTNGMLHVSHDSGAGHPYTGSVPLVSGEIGEDLAHYLAVSLQVPSAVSVGVRVGTGGVLLGAAGILAQRLPDGDLAAARTLEAALERIGPVSSAAEAGTSARSLVEEMSSGLGHGAVQEIPVAWRCTCSRERTGRVLATLGTKAIDEMISEDDGAELRCQFCGAVYRFSADDLRALRRP